MKSAAESLGLKTSSIERICSGKANCTLAINGVNYQFAYYEEGEEYKLKEVDTSNHKIKKKVECVETGRIFESTKEAARELNLQQSKISLVCNGKRIKTGGLTFKFIQ